VLVGHLQEVRELAAPLGIRFMAGGFRPFGTLDDVPWLPKRRYKVMREYLPGRGRLGLEMMKRTATVQANLDYADEDDAGRKFAAGMGVASLVTALFANSPLADGRDTGWQSWRARAWLETDPDRCGLLPFAFTPGSLFRRYTEWALDVPMFFVYRDGYRPAGGMTFRRFLRDGFQGERATREDWELHLSTLFPEVRLKHYLEMRSADAGTMPMVLALPVLWKGLLYDDNALAATLALTARFTFAERQALRAEVPRAGLAAKAPGGATVRDLARDLVAAARDGLTRIAPDEVAALAPLEEIVATGRAPADRVRDLHRAAAGDPRRLVDALRL
jgi:glutamate--cysteine ligase